MKNHNITDFEDMISKNAASLRSGVIYSGAVSAAQSVKRPDNTKKASFFSFPGAKVAAAFITAAAVGTATYFFCLYLGRRGPTNPPDVTGTETVETTVAPGTDTEPLTETDNAVTVPAETTAPETDETVTADETTAPPDTEGTETTAEHETTTPETTAPETTVPETTTPETTTPETTVPETTAPETTAPETTAPDTEPVYKPVYSEDVKTFFDLEQKHHPSFKEALKIYTDTKYEDLIPVKEIVSLLGKPHGMIGYELSVENIRYCWVLDDGRIFNIRIFSFEMKDLNTFSDVLNKGKFQKSLFMLLDTVSASLEYSVNETTRCVQNGLTPCTLYYNGEPVPENLGPAFDFEKLIHDEKKSVQKNHQTDENAVPSDKAAKKADTDNTVRYYIKLTDYTEKWSIYNGAGSPVSVAGQKIWVCDRDGNKIDYVMTNSKGIASFDLYPGTYKFVRETTGIDAHQDEDEIIIVRKSMSVVILRENESVSNRVRALDLFEKGVFDQLNVRIKVIDRDTKKPLSGAVLTYPDGFILYSDKNGEIFINAEDLFYVAKPYVFETEFTFKLNSNNPVLTCENHRGMVIYDEFKDGEVIELEPPRVVTDVIYNVKIIDLSTDEYITGATVRVLFKEDMATGHGSLDPVEATPLEDGTYSLAFKNVYFEDFKNIYIYVYYDYAYPGQWSNGLERTDYCRIIYENTFSINTEEMKRGGEYVFGVDLARIREEKAGEAITEDEFTLISVTYNQ